jgi:hypothetical protein
VTVTVRRAAADACKRCLCEWAPLCVKELDDQADGGGGSFSSLMLSVVSVSVVMVVSVSPLLQFI